jgi:hypothetical protein
MRTPTKEQAWEAGRTSSNPLVLALLKSSVLLALTVGEYFIPELLDYLR